MLEEEIAAGRFREDLYYRLNVVPIHVPPLRERREDIPLLASHFVRTLSRARGRSAARASIRRRVERLTQLDWPGNVRELRNTIERLLILVVGPAHRRRDDVERLVGRRDRGQRGPRLAARVQDVRGVQARGRARVPARQAARVRLERVGDGARARHAALEPVQEDRAVRPDERDGVLMSGREIGTRRLKKIDQQLEVDVRRGAAARRRRRRRAAGARRGGREAAAARRRSASWRGLARARGRARRRRWCSGRIRRACGVGARRLSRRGRRGRRRRACGASSGRGGIARRAAHVLSLLLILWGGVLGAIEVLPRIGYAKPDADTAPAGRARDRPSSGDLARTRAAATLRHDARASTTDSSAIQR